MREKIEFTPDYGSRANNAKIKVIGVGGGGGNAVKHMYKEGIIGVDFLICNTDQQALYNNPVPAKLVLGSSGLGAGANPEVARELAEESAEALKEFIGAETEMLFIAAGMGKGTGTGAAPVVARIAREMNILTIGVVTFPFEYEFCDKRAMAGIAEIKKYVDSLIIIRNEKIFVFYPDALIHDAFGLVDDVLKNAVKCIAEMITKEAVVNVDFNDVKSIMKDSKSAMLGIATANGENRAEEVVESAMHCPLLDLDMITNAKNVLFFVDYGTEAPVAMNEMKTITKNLKRYHNENVRVIWGQGYDASLGKDLKLSVILTDYETVEQKKKEEGVIEIPEIPINPVKNTVLTETENSINILPIDPTNPDEVAVEQPVIRQTQPIPEPVLNRNFENPTPPPQQPTRPIDPINFDNDAGEFGVRQSVSQQTQPISEPIQNTNFVNPTPPPQQPTRPISPSSNPSSVTKQAVLEQVVLPNGQVEIYALNDDIYEDDKKYSHLIDTPAVLMRSSREKLIEKPERIFEFNPFQIEQDNDANEFLNSLPD